MARMRSLCVSLAALALAAPALAQDVSGNGVGFEGALLFPGGETVLQRTEVLEDGTYRVVVRDQGRESLPREGHLVLLGSFAFGPASRIVRLDHKSLARAGIQGTVELETLAGHYVADDGREAVLSLFERRLSLPGLEPLSFLMVLGEFATPEDALARAARFVDSLDDPLTQAASADGPCRRCDYEAFKCGSPILEDLEGAWFACAAQFRSAVQSCAPDGQCLDQVATSEFRCRALALIKADQNLEGCEVDHCDCLVDCGQLDGK